MKRAYLDKFVRIKKNENYETLRQLEVQILNRVRVEFASEVNPIKIENESFRIDEKLFTDNAKEILSTLTPKDTLKVVVQVGPGSTVIRTHIGHIEHKFNKYQDGTFNFMDEDHYDGKPFTIGFSCLMGIEVIE